MTFLQLQNWYKHRKALIYTRLIRAEFGALGEGSLIHPPFHSHDLTEVYLGARCSVHAGGWIACIKEDCAGQKFTPRLEIGDDTYFGHRVHVLACGPMRIGRHVVCADGVYISDNSHGFEDIHHPIMPQPLVHPGPVIIEDEVWLGEGVCVLPNVTIGKHTVVGCNAVVSKSLPPYCVAVGVPAQIVKRYDEQEKTWVRVPRCE